MKLHAKLLILALLIISSGQACAERIKDLATIRGVRENQLIGYGLVAGLDGSGDQTTQTPFTVQSIISMMQQLGVAIPAGTSLQLKNIAAVMVTASLPPFSQPGQQLDVTVSSMGNAKSLSGGTLLMTPLKGADNQVYAMAQGNVLVGGVGAAAAGSKVQINHLSVGRISGGATVEKAVASTLGTGEHIHLELRDSDFSTATRVVNALNQRFGTDTAVALDSRVIKVRAPIDSDSRVAFIGDMESLDINPAQMAAKIILNARTGSIVMNQAVTLDTCAVAHGNLQVIITAESKVSQPNAFAGGKTEVTEKADIEIKKEPGLVVLVKAGVSLADVVKSLNSIGATPQDLLAILQAMKASGALHAELEII
ncbi:flagellar P-ring protein precursor FlgI [Oxalobacteraceae bacterium GrIS 2.11]